MIHLRPTHLRARLTLWFVSVLAGLLILAWGATFTLLFWQLRSQLDHFAIQEVETVEGLLYVNQKGELQMREDYHNHPESKDVIDRFVEVLSPEGSVLYRNERLGDRMLGGHPFVGEGVGGYSVRSERLAGGTRVRMVSRMHSLDGRLILIRLGHNEEPLWSGINEMLIASVIVLPVVLALAGFAGYGLVRRALGPIEQMARRAQEITPQRLHERLPNDNADDELGQLARVFNATLARLEQAFEQLRRFTSDASHELRTPLAAIRSVGEVGLQKGGSSAEYRDIIGSMLEEVNRLTSLVDNLLTISRADAGSLQLQMVQIPILQLAREAASLFEVMAEEKSLDFLLSGDEAIAVQGDRLFLRQALVNVLHNAVKYSPDGGTISVRVQRNAQEVTVEVEDSGPGVPAEDRAKIFDRFYRVDKARWRESGGAGLGLSITKWVVEAHGGTIGLDGASARGCLFRIQLPRESAP
ncbi:MAG: heavy metal sensor histidine kinase [Bryobacteraceae bacterium]